MSEVKVERRHRTAALLAVGFPPESTVFDEPSTLHPRFERIAQALAEAEQRGYQRCQNDAVAKAERDAATYRSIDRSERAQGAGNALAAFAKELARNEHIGASDSVPSAGSGTGGK